MQVACIGECMVELRETAPGTLLRTHGGDTLNTAVYLARLGVPVDYITALGDDGWSEEMLAAWAAEGVGTSQVRRIAGRLPGLYVIQTDAAGERRFLYWRDAAAARLLFDLPDPPDLRAYRLAYLSGITLSIYAPPAREALFAALAALRAAGGQVAFDTNFRARGWPDRAEAALWFARALAASDLVFASIEDLAQVFPDAEAALAAHAPQAERVLKLPTPCVRITAGGQTVTVPAPAVPRVVDTTAAGDSFAAGYLARRLAGDMPEAAARAGHRLAGAVVGHPGAIIPRHAMPEPEAIP